jgi:hypothetical protein
MTRGKRTNFKDQDELKELLEAAWNRLEEVGSSNIEHTKTNRIAKSVLSVKSVCEEAGCSRSLVGHEKCPYPMVRLWLKDRIAAQAAGEPSPLISLNENIALLKHKLKARYRAYGALCKRLGISWTKSVEPDEDVQEVGEGSIKMRIDELNGRVAKLENQIALFDTQYANVILRQRLANLGLRSDMRPITPASKAKRRASVSLVGKSLKAQREE